MKKSISMVNTCLAILVTIIVPFQTTVIAENIVSPTTTPFSTSIPTPYATPSPSPVAIGSFGQLGYFSIDSPTNKAYNTNNITLTLSSQTIAASYLHLTMTYSIDGQEKIPINLELEQPHDWWDSFFVDSNESVALPPLTSGSHNVTVFGNFGNPNASFPYLSQATIYFTIAYPSISYLLPENQTYNSYNFPLDFSVNSQYSWLGYSIDNLANVTIAGNTTLTELSNGYHSLVVYANDSFGNMGKSETINFTIAKPESFPTMTFAVSGVIAAVVAIACLVLYRKKSKMLT
jgi:hypothetical protein